MTSVKTTTDKGRVLPKIFDRDPELKKQLEAYLASVPEHKKEEDFANFKKFVEGEMTWAEVKGYPKPLLKELARIAYLKYQVSDYQTAETLFKGLSIIDHLNWYYRTALGAIYQKQKLFEQAVEEYSISLSLNEKEIIALTNRGECYLELQNRQAALEDFEKAIALDPQNKDSWGKRARALKNKMMESGSGDGLPRKKSPAAKGLKAPTK